MKYSLALTAVLAIASIDQQVVQELDANNQADIFLQFEQFDYASNEHLFGVAHDIQNVSDEMAWALRGIERQNVYDVLNRFADTHQAEVRRELEEAGVEFKVHWALNEIFVPNASKDLVDRLSFNSNIQSIVGNTEYPLMQPVEMDSTAESPDNIQWNLKHVKAPEAWKITKGKGAVVANIDTGVMFNHEALYLKYRGYDAKTNSYDHDYNFYDPVARNGVPSDTQGHGTHTMGSIVGSTKAKAFGVALDAKFIVAKGCRNSSCTREDLLTSGEWVVCPTKMDGTAPNCNRGADVVSNSWGGGRGNDWYGRVVDAWIRAKMIPAFSAGNSGSRCSTANSPGDLGNVISVASSNRQYGLSYFSSRGPGPVGSRFSQAKPDITAPGQDIFSTTRNGSYGTMSGTSMACPHVAGVATLMISANPKLGYNELYQAIASTASTKSLIKPDRGSAECGGKVWNVFPNNHYGFGLVNAEDAVKAVKK